MFVMISPLQAHLSETLTSLKFATKVSRARKLRASKISTDGRQVHNTHIGAAKKQIKVKE